MVNIRNSNLLATVFASLVALANGQTVPSYTTRPVKQIRNENQAGCVAFAETTLADINNLPVKVPPSGNLTIATTLFLQSFIGVNTLDQTVQASLLIRFMWLDQRLGSEFDKSACNRLPLAIQHAASLWYPRFSIVNSLDPPSPTDMDAISILLFSNGVLQLNMEIKTEVTCSLNLYRFPYDYHTCYFQVVPTNEFIQAKAQSYYKEMTNKSALQVLTTSVHPESTIIAVSEGSADNPLFRMGRTCTIIGSPNTYMFSHAFLLFEIDRKPAYYTPVVFIPTGIVSALMSVVFIARADDDEKLGVALTVLLSYFVISYSLSSELPTTSDNTPLIYMFYCYLMMLSTGSTMMAALIRNHHKREEARKDEAENTKNVSVRARKNCKICNCSAHVLNTIALVTYTVLCVLGYVFYFAELLASDSKSDIGSVSGENSTCIFKDMMTTSEFMQSKFSVPDETTFS